jgi:predicted nucleic acid-binding protein
MYLVDTNIFLEILLCQKNAVSCQTFLEYTQEKNIPIICTHFSIHSISVRLSCHKKFRELHDFIQNIQNMPNLYVHSTILEEERTISNLCHKIGLDFDDTIQYHTAKTFQCHSIVSYDKDFDKTNLKRITPENFLITHPDKKNSDKKDKR